jgi:WD40 repeat protein/tetratricopeptide (TPR) repeat protein
MSRIDCPSLDRLSDFVLGKLAIDELATVAEHLDACPDCERQIAQLDGMGDSVVSKLKGISTAATKAGNQTEPASPPGGAEMPAVSGTWGEFRIVREIGRGGMGLVCEAFQDSLNRHVALKFLPEHGNLSRFRREAQAAGRLHHTNIVPVFGVGEHLGRHFYVMQYIAGRGLDAVLKERAAAAAGTGRSRARPDAREAARIGAQVAGALAYAHGQGVIHRDIKPSNLLLDDQGAVWITDFGLAKVADQQDLTRTGDFLGTLRYMPPEAFEGRYDARGDIYALGLTLYELVALRPAYDESDRARLIRLVTAGAPPRLRDLDRAVPRDLETMIHKAIERDPSHRYQTATALAEDLGRFIEDRPIRARRIGEAERFARWCRRNPVPAGLLAALFLVFWVGFGLVAWEWRAAVAEREAKEEQVVKANAAADRALSAEKTALDAADRAGRRLYFSLIDRARLEHQAANIAEAEAILDRCEPARRGWEWHFLKSLDHAELFTLRGHGEQGWVDAVAYSPDGKWIATAGGGDPFWENTGKVVPGTVVVWDAETGRPAHTLRSHKHLVRQVAFNRDGRLVASSSLDGTVQLHEPATGRLVRTLVAGKAYVPGAPHAQDSARLLAMAPDGRRLATSSDDNAVAIWDLASGHRSPLPVRADTYAKAVFSPDGRRLATLTGTYPYEAMPARVWNAATGAEAPRPEGQELYCSLAVSPDSCTLAGGSNSGYVSLWNLADGKQRQTLTGHQGQVLGVAFSIDGLYLASAGQDRTVRVWAVKTGASLRTIRGHTDMVTSVAFSPDGDRLVTGSQDGTSRVWDLTFDDEVGGGEMCGFRVPAPPEAIAYGQAGREHRIFMRNGAVRRYETGSFSEPDEIVTGLNVGWRSPAELAAFDAEGRRVVARAGDAPRVAVCVDLDGDARRTTLRGHTLEVSHATLSADGTRIATAASSGLPESRDEVFVWDAATGRMLHRREVAGESIARIALDPTGRRLALSAVRTIPPAGGAGSRPDPFVAVVDVDSGCEVLHSGVLDEWCLALGFNGDGRRLAAAGVDRMVLIWDLGSSAAALRTRQGPEGAMDLSFSPDGRRLAVASRQQIKLMDAETAEEVLTLRGSSHLVPHNHGFNPRVRFSPDGRDLFAICDDRMPKQMLSVWSRSRDNPGEPAARSRMALRRATDRHIAQAERLSWERGPERLIALVHLDHARRIGLESTGALIKTATILASFDLWARADADLDQAVALAPGNDELLRRAGDLWVGLGQFRRAGIRYARMSDMPPTLLTVSPDCYGYALLLAGDHAHYRQLCAQAVKRFESDPDLPWDPSSVAYTAALGPDSGVDAETRIRIARRGYDGASAFEGRRRCWAALGLGAAHVRAGACERAEQLFREAIAYAPNESLRALSAAWLAIASWRQGRREESRTWFGRADRFVRAQLPDDRPDLDHRSPSVAEWAYVLIAWREAWGLLLDVDFPADSFVR